LILSHHFVTCECSKEEIDDDDDDDTCVQRFECLVDRFHIVYRQSPLGPVDPSFRTLSGRLRLTVRRHKFNKDSLFIKEWGAGLSCGAWALWFVVPDLGFGLLGFGYVCVCLGCRVSAFWFLVSGFWSLISGLWCLVSGFRFRVSGFGSRISGFRFRVSGF
jgi:hypothetical protein